MTGARAAARKRRTLCLCVLCLCYRVSLGAIAQLGERVLCKHEVVGSIPSGSTSLRADGRGGLAARPSECGSAAVSRAIGNDVFPSWLRPGRQSDIVN